MPFVTTIDGTTIPVKLNSVWQVAGYQEGELCVVNDFSQMKDLIVIDVFEGRHALLNNDMSMRDLVSSEEMEELVYDNVYKYRKEYARDVHMPRAGDRVAASLGAEDVKRIAEEVVNRLGTTVTGDDVDRIAGATLEAYKKHEKQRVPVLTRLDVIGRGDLFKYFLTQLRAMENPKVLHDWLDNATAPDHLKPIDKRSLANMVQFLLTAEGPAPNEVGISAEGIISLCWEQVEDGKRDKVLCRFLQNTGMVHMQVLKPGVFAPQYNGTTNTAAAAKYLREFSERFDPTMPADPGVTKQMQEAHRAADAEGLFTETIEGEPLEEKKSFGPVVDGFVESVARGMGLVDDLGSQDDS